MTDTPTIHLILVDRTSINDLAHGTDDDCEWPNLHVPDWDNDTNDIFRNNKMAR